MKKNIKEFLSYIIIIICVVLFRTFVATPVVVDGPSMNPTLNNGDFLILKKFDKTYDRMDIVVFRYNDEDLIKRVIGLPGEKVEFKDSKLYVNDKLVDDYSNSTNTKDYTTLSMGIEKIPKGYYFVMGDNRNNSTDSRIIGLVSEKVLQGTVDFRIFNGFGKIK